MCRLKLIVCLVLSDVNVFLKLSCGHEKRKKTFNGLITTVILCILH